MPLKAARCTAGNLSRLFDGQVAYLHEFHGLTLSNGKGSQGGLDLLDSFLPLYLFRWEGRIARRQLTRIGEGLCQSRCAGSPLLAEYILYDAPEQFWEGGIEQMSGLSGPGAGKYLLNQIIQPATWDASTGQKTYDPEELRLVEMLELRCRFCSGTDLRRAITMEYPGFHSATTCPSAYRRARSLANQRQGIDADAQLRSRRRELIGRAAGVAASQIQCAPLNPSFNLEQMGIFISFLGIGKFSIFKNGPVSTKQQNAAVTRSIPAIT